MEEDGTFDTITTDFLENFIAKYDRAWKESSGAEMAALCTEDVIWDDAALPEPAHGPAGVAEWIRYNFQVYPDIRYEAPDPPALSVDARTAYLKWILLGTNTGPIDPPGFAATGREVEVPGIDEYRFRDGLLAHYRSYFDVHGMLTQLGLTPARGSRTFKTLVRLQRLRNRQR
jgi:steroid delta-isomerase-like uncharacterized protein